MKKVIEKEKMIFTEAIPNEVSYLSYLLSYWFANESAGPPLVLSGELDA